MGVKAVDLRGVLVADLPKGRLESRERHRLVAVPGEWWNAVLSHLNGDVARSLADGVVRDLVHEANAVLDGSADHEPEAIAHALCVAFATRGLGRVAFESWGDALVFVWCDAPASGAGFEAFASEVVSRVVGDVSGVRVGATALGTQSGDLRLLVASATSCDHVRQAMSRGGTFPQVLATLERGEAAR